MASEAKELLDMRKIFSPDQFDRVLVLNKAQSRVTLDELQRLREFLSYRMIFNSDYQWGYLSALLDLQAMFESDFFETVCKTCKIPKNFKTMSKLIRFMIKNMEVLRDRFKEIQLGYDPVKKDFFRCMTKNVKVLVVENETSDEEGFELKPFSGGKK